MRRIRRRKVLYLSMLSLIILMSFSLSCLKASAISITSADASLVLPVEKPEVAAGWILFHNASNPSSLFDIPPITGTVRNPTSQNIWWAQFNFQTTHHGYTDPTFVAGFKYTDGFDFTVGLVYSLTFDIMLTAQANGVPEPDFTKLYIMFPRSGWSTTKQWTLSDFYEAYAPSSVVVQSQQGIAGYPTSARITYNFPIYPESTFPDNTLYHDGAGFDYISFDSLYFWDDGVYWNNNRYVNWHETDISGVYRWQEVYRIYSISASSMSPEEYRDRLIQGSVDQLSDRIDANGDKVAQAIDQGVDEILNGGDPVDFSELDNYHNQESALIDNILSTAPYDPDDAAAIFSTSNWATLLKGATFTNNWYNYVFANNSLIGFLLTLGMAFAVAHQALKGLL